MDSTEQIYWDLTRAVSVRLPHVDLEVIYDTIVDRLYSYLKVGDVIRTRALAQVVDDVTELLTRD